MNLYLSTDSQIQKGYNYLEKDNYIKCCDIWLDAWWNIKGLMVEEGKRTIQGIDDIYEWTYSIYNYVQDLEEELRNAGVLNKEYYHKRLEYCKELYEHIDSEDQLMRENTLRSIPETYFLLGEHERAEQEFETMLTNDPTAGWVYIGYASCYALELEHPRYDKAMDIMIRGLNVPDLRERSDVLECADAICQEFGTADAEKSKLYKHELHKLSSARVTKIGRNEPCPCGSGTKYKKCCGK